MGWAASSSANSGFKYAYRGMAEAEAAAAKTLGVISKTTTILSHGAAFAGIAAAGLQFANSNQIGADYARLGGAAIITGTAFIPIAGTFISIGLGVLDSYGAFDGIYNSFGSQPTLNPGRR